MAVIALASASGAPGVTTAALALTLLWPRPVLLVEASPFGGSGVLAGYLRGAIAPEGRSLLALAGAQRHGRLREAIEENTVALDDEGRRQLLPAIAQPEQAASLDRLWEPLAELLPQLADHPGTQTATDVMDSDVVDRGGVGSGGVDVIVDAGRLGAAHGPEPLLRGADLVLMCVRTQLPAVAAAKARIGAMHHLLAPSHPYETLSRPPGEADGYTHEPPGGRLGLLVIGDGRPYTGAEVAGVVGAPLIATLAWDQPAADVLALGSPRPRRWEQSALVRSAAAATDAVQRRLASSPCGLHLVGEAGRG